MTTVRHTCDVDGHNSNVVNSFYGYFLFNTRTYIVTIKHKFVRKSTYTFIPICHYRPYMYNNNTVLALIDRHEAFVSGPSATR